MIGKDGLSSSMRWMDSVGFEIAFNESDLNMNDTLYCAKQRALRVLAARRGHEYFTEWSSGSISIDLTADERDLLAALETMWIDGLINGIRTHAHESK